MAKTVSFDFRHVSGMASAEDISAIKDEVIAAKETLVNRNGEGNDFLGFGLTFRLIMIRMSLQESKKGGCKDTVRFRCAGSNWYWRFLPWRKSSNRSFKTQLL